MTKKIGAGLLCTFLTAAIFAAVNGNLDRLGHDIGDSVLSLASKRIAQPKIAAVAADQTPVSLLSELPAHDPTVGKLAGSASTSGGSASYSIPITLPPGRRGMQPAVSLNYSSRAGNGIAGVGWSLSGASSLHRCPATIEQDGRIGAVSLTTADKLCLDGQRLIPTSGNYGALNTTYGTELESFSRITQLGGDLASASTYFKVETKSGEILWYGNNSGAANAARVVPGGVTVPLSWMLVRKEDRVGNFIRYAYANVGNGEVLLSDIFYTGFGSTDGDRSVHFTYEARPTGAAGNDQTSSYLAGGVTMQTQRLSLITTWSGIATDPNNKVREYRLSYGGVPSLSTRRSLLASVTECGFAPGQASACHRPTTFAWQQGPLQSVFHPAVMPGGLPILKIIGDLNGDGSREVLAGTYGGTMNLVSFNADRSVRTSIDVSNFGITGGYGLDTADGSDFDLDGHTDLYGFDANNNLIIKFWDGPSTATTAAQAFTRIWNTGIQGTGQGANVVHIGDMDGDGRADVVVQRGLTNTTSSCSARLEVYRNVASASGPSAPATFPLLSTTCLAGINWSGYQVNETIEQVQDLNGDGLPDILLTYPQLQSATYPAGAVLYAQRTATFQFNRATYASMFPAASPATADEQNGASYKQWIDINGDGLKDLLHADLGGTWSLRLNNGKGLGNRIAFTNKNGIEKCVTKKSTGCSQTWSPWYGKRIQVADVDGDGREELLIPRRFASQICLAYTDYSNPGEPEPYFACPEDPFTGAVNAAAVSNVSAQETVRGSYFEGVGFQDRSAYLMNALRFVQTGANQFQIIEDQTSLVNGEVTYPGDLYGDGLADSFTDVSCGYNPSVCMVAAGAGTPATLPGGYPHLSTGPFINEGLGPNGTLNPDGKTPELPDLMSMVTDGLGAQTIWTYYPLTSTAGRTAGQTPLYTVPTDVASKYVDDRHIYFTSSMPVVSDMATTDGIGGYHSVRYGYSQAMYNEQGRGFQGFRSIIEEDLTSGLRTTTIFNQKFPLASQVQEVFVNALVRQGVDAPIKHDLYTWRCNRANRNDATACTPPSGNATIKFPFLDKKESWTFDAAVAALPTGTPQAIGYSQDVNADHTTCTSAGTFASASGFDGYGNLTAHTTMGSDAGTGAAGFRPFVSLMCNNTRAVYAPADAVAWWLDKLNSTTALNTIAYNSTNHALPAGVSAPTQTVATSYTWNADRTPATQTVQTGVTNQQRVTSYAYPSLPKTNYGLPSAVAVAASGDPNGTRTSAVTYSADGYFAATSTNALGQSTQVTITPRDGQPALAIDANGMRTLMTYDVFGQLLRTQFHGTTDTVQATPDKLFARSWCNGTCLPGAQALFKTTDVQDGAPTRIVAYDLLGRTLLSAQWVSDTTLPLSVTQYDALGHVAQQSNPYDGAAQHLFWTTFQYDLIGRVTQKVVPKGADDGRGNLKTTYAYSGNQTAIQVCGSADVGTTNCLNMTRTTDSMGRYMETVDAKNGRTQYWVDAIGNTAALVDAKASITSASYNAIGQRSSVSDPNQGTWSFGYNALGEVLTQTDARGIVTSSSYDKLGRPLSRTATIDVTGDGVADNVADSWTYDPLNGVGKPATSQRLVNGAIERRQTYGYDSLSRPAQTDTTQQIATGTTKGYTQTLAYDTYYGRPKSTTYPNNETVGTYYSKYGIPIKSFNPANGQVYREVTAVDMTGLPTVAALGDGLLTDTRSYRIPTGELLQIKTSRGAAVLRQLDYQTDVFGNLTKQTLNSGATVEAFAYDTLQRMTQATRTGAANAAISYAYDAAGNFTSKSDFSTTAINGYQYATATCGGGPNAVKKVLLATGGARTYCYDADGNLTSDNAGLAIKYDSYNLPYQTTRNTITINLAYGPENQRTRQWGSDGTKVYVDGYEDWISAGMTKVYVGSAAEVTTTTTGTRTVNYLLTDRLGSVDAVADSSGTLVETRGSDAFGKPRLGTWADASPARLQSTAITAKGFTGHEHLNGVELIHMKGRVYDYQIGRFLSVDPFIQFPLNSQSLNPYSYIMNNPLSGTDPTGYESVCVNGKDCAQVTHEAPTGSHIASNAVLSGKKDGISFSVTVDKHANMLSGTFSGSKTSSGASSGQGVKSAVLPSKKPDEQPSQPWASDLNDSAGKSLPKPDAPDPDVLALVKKVSPQFEACGVQECCANICVNSSKQGADRYSLSTIVTQHSHNHCDPSPSVCAAGSVKDDDLHNHLKPGFYRANLSDEKMSNQRWIKGDQITLNNQNALSHDDMASGTNTWVIPEGTNLLLYRPKTELYPVHLEFQRSP